MGFKTSRRQLLRTLPALGAAMVYPRQMMAASGKSLTIAMVGDIQVLDPLNHIAELDYDIANAIHPKLIAYKPGNKFEWELDAAESIDQVDDTHITFRLRPGIMFTNDFGELTADDVKFSFERVANPENESSYIGDWEPLDRVDVNDAYSGTIVLKRPFAPLWRTTLPWYTGSIVSKKAVEAVGGKFTTDPPASAGPYYIREWRPKQQYVLARNPGWPGPGPYFDEIVVLSLDDTDTAAIAFDAGEVDYTKIGASAIPYYRENLAEDSRLIEFDSLDYFWLGMNIEKSPYDDIRVRKAIQRGVDVGSIIDAAYFGVSEQATGIVPPSMLGYRDVEPIQRNVAEARRLLEEAGYPNGFDTRLDVINRVDLTAASQVIQAALAEIGVNVSIHTYDEGTFWSLPYDSPDTLNEFELMFRGYGGAPDPSWATEWFVCDQIWSWERWCSVEFDQLHEEARMEVDEDKRTSQYTRMQDLMEDSGAYVFVVHPPLAALSRTTVIPATSPNGRLRLSQFAPA